jgi:hypothetical protein
MGILFSLSSQLSWQGHNSYCILTVAFANEANATTSHIYKYLTLWKTNAVGVKTVCSFLSRMRAVEPASNFLINPKRREWGGGSIH